LTGSDAERTEWKHREITDRIIGAAYEVYNCLGSGFLESVYENALVLELSEVFDSVERQCPLVVIYKGHQLGRFEADVIVDRKVIVELKSIDTLQRVHEVQLMNYLKATGIEVGLLINFGPERLDIRRKALHLPPLSSSPVNPADPVIRSNSSEKAK